MGHKELDTTELLNWTNSRPDLFADLQIYINNATNKHCNLNKSKTELVFSIPFEDALIHYSVLVNKQGFPGGSDGKESACNARDSGLIPGSGDALEKRMATHSSIFAWRIPWTEELGRLQSTSSQE